MVKGSDYKGKKVVGEDIAEELDESPNGVRMILTKAGVYVKKSPATNGNGGSTGGSGRVSKAAMQEELIAAISDAGQTVDNDIIDKLEKNLNIPVLSSNQALIWDTLVKINKNNSIEGFGKLFQAN